MNKLLTLLLLFIAVPLFSQAVNWGTEFDFGTAFTKTDSLKIRTTVTEVDTSDTVYTKMLDITNRLGKRQTRSEKQMIKIQSELTSLNNKVDKVDSTVLRMDDNINSIKKFLMEEGLK